MATRGGLDISGILQNAFHLFKGKFNHVCLGPCDGFVLKMHYRWAFYFTIGSFMTVWYGWYFGKVIHCVSSFKGDQEARTDYTNICLSYPYILDDSENKRYLLFYRWIHWSFLFIAAIYYIPRKVSKSFENPKSKKIFEDLAALSSRYDQTEKELIQRSTFYMIANMKTHNSIYFKYLGLNILAFFIDIFVLFFLDFLLHNRFISLVPKSYPFHRDPDTFKDYISQTFPPFASCYLQDHHKILDGRKEELGCHLTYMELFEKLFIIYWFLIYILLISTLFHCIFLIFMLIPKHQKHFLATSKPLYSSESMDIIISKTLIHTKVGDIYILYRLKQHLGPSRFFELLLKLSDLKVKQDTSTVVENEASILKPNLYPNLKEEENLRNRSYSQNKNAPPFNPQFPNHSGQDQTRANNPNLLNRLLNEPNNMPLVKNYPEILKANKASDRSILIE